MSAQNQSCDGALKLSAPLPTDAIEPTAKTLCTTVAKTINGTVSSASNFVGQSKSATIHGNSWVALEFIRRLRNALSEPIKPEHIPLPRFHRSHQRRVCHDNAKPILRRCSAASYSSSYRTMDNAYHEASKRVQAACISHISIAFSFMPHWDDLRAYTGYFYALTYTVQINIVPSRTSYPAPYTSSVTPLTVFPFLSGFCSNHGYTFDAAYTLHSRGWSSGATSPLSFYVIDFTITSQGGSTFRIEPQPGNILMYGTLMRSF
ncbi:glycoside hydrolase family 78 protein [Sphaerobolus stellatus SS14]|uniref:Glycoside hydrolase family 78 protein n=1 Tax=Sphaerobolus stellatus (strain SS14) TaxID=990650 RepID=A0A0C9VNT2_SPHS4|nr:glycoside hydrolase family 78 protein [Sphaerobolus stellatus SS14]